MRDTGKFLCFVVCALAFLAFGVAQSMADGTFPGLLQPGQILGNSGATAGPATAVSPNAIFSGSGYQLFSTTQLYATPSGSGGVDTGYCQTLATACTLRHACEVRSSIFTASPVGILLTGGTYSDVDATWNSLCANHGNAGGVGSALTQVSVISGTATLVVPSNGNGFDIEDHAEIGIVGVTITGGTNSTGIVCRQFSICDYTNVIWGTFTSNGVHVAMVSGSSVNCDGAETINTTTTFTLHWEFSGAGQAGLNCTTTVLSNLSYNFFLYAFGNVTIQAQSWSLSNSGSFSLSGQRAYLIGNGYLVTGAVPCSSWFPGSVVCQLLQGFADDAGDQVAPVANGGTGATSASAARSNLGLGTLSTVTPGTGVATALGNNANASGGVPTVPVANSDLANSSTIVAGQTCALGSTCGLSTASNTLSSDVSLSNASNYFDGPSMVQGSTGTWWVSGNVQLDSSTSDTFRCKLWDGTTVIASAQFYNLAGDGGVNQSLSGLLASPAGNIRISCRDVSTANGAIRANSSANSHDSTIWGIRIN